MPESDSVRRTAARLERALVGRTVVHSDLRVPRHATADLRGAVVREVVPRGKHLLTRFDTGLTLHTHQRMDGSWTVLRPGRRLPPALVPDVRVLLAVEDGTAVVGLRMPVVELLATRDEDTVVGHLGPDVLAPDFDEDEAVRRLRAEPQRPVVEALLDQRGVAGLGNLWAVESLYLRGVYPWAAVADVDLPALLRLARRMMTYALTEPGQVTTGERRPGASHHVYGRAGRPCRRCRTPVAFRAASGHPYERETWWCPVCQPAPRSRAARRVSAARARTGGPHAAAGAPGENHA